MDTGFTNRRDSDAMNEYRAYQDREDLAKYRNLYWEQKEEITTLRAQIEEMKCCENCEYEICDDLTYDRECKFCIYSDGLCSDADNWKRRSN